MPGKDDISVLVIEDDPEVNALITRYVRNEGYHVDVVHDGTAAVEMIVNRTYHLLILDIMIPGMDGLELLRRVRRRARMPVIIVSAKSEESDKITGLEIGADDYLTKPFSVKELVARVHAQLRRYIPNSGEDAAVSQIVSYGDLRLNAETINVRKGGHPVNLTSTEFHILKLLMENPGTVFTKSKIRDRVWSEEYCLEDNTIMVHIRNIRKKIEDDPANPEILKTVWGFGYAVGV